MDVKKKILFLIPSMRGGGVEKVMTIISSHLDKNKFDIILVLLKKEGEQLKNLPNTVKVVDLNVSKARYALMKLYWVIKLNKPDIVMPTMGYLNAYLALIIPFFSKDIKFIARESSVVSVINKEDKLTKILNFLYKYFYNRYEFIICESNFVKDDLINNFHIQEDKLNLIRNPVDITKIIQLSNETKEAILNNNKINLIAVGRLEHVKGYDLLIQAIAKLDQNFHLTILGKGNEEEKLRTLVSRLNIKDRVTFSGFQNNPFAYMKQSDIFVLSSRYEGSPNVVLEANACGAPVVAFNCPGGTGEIIENGINGFLCECGNIDELVEKINKASSHSFDKNKIKSLTKNRYNVNTIIKQYERLFL